MKFLYVTKKNPICHYNKCGGYVHQGELYVLEHKVNRNGKSEHFGKHFVLTFHYECYKAYILEAIEKKALKWSEKARRPTVGVSPKTLLEEERRRKNRKDKPVLGRPKKYDRPMIARNLLASIYYHRKQGHTDKVTELERRLADVTTVRLSLPQV